MSTLPRILTSLAAILFVSFLCLFALRMKGVPP
jgi:hypothetical protein